MLASANRLRSASDIARVYKRGAYGGSGGALSVKAIKSGRPQTRAVIVVGKKVSKRAVIRNRIRRRLSETLRGLWGTVPVGYDIILSVHTDISGASASEITGHITKALGRAGIIAS